MAKNFNVIDTGGFVPNSDDVFEKAIREQVQIAIEEALPYRVYGRWSPQALPTWMMKMARMLRRSDKTVLVAVNKVDNSNRLIEGAEFYSLGFEHTHFLSSINGSGTGDLLDTVTSFIPDEEDDEKEENRIPRFAIIGQPNVGKSSLVNALIGEPRHIVTNIAGTTRDSINTHYRMFGMEFLLIDTAGIRKKAKVHENLEFYSVLRAINAMDEANVCLLVLDATLGIESQDLNIMRLAYKKRKGIVILVNKWDLVEKETNTARDLCRKNKGQNGSFYRCAHHIYFGTG